MTDFPRPRLPLLLAFRISSPGTPTYYLMGKVKNILPHPRLPHGTFALLGVLFLPATHAGTFSSLRKSHR